MTEDQFVERLSFRIEVYGLERVRFAIAYAEVEEMLDAYLTKDWVNYLLGIKGPIYPQTKEEIIQLAKDETNEALHGDEDDSVRERWLHNVDRYLVPQSRPNTLQT